MKILRRPYFEENTDAFKRFRILFMLLSPVSAQLLYKGYIKLNQYQIPLW
ncbi:hypothetical protein HMPREF9104_01851 [Lentilactobacillus kisonensis F0435]|uniref:Uncharacterized protein n=1 Tax=Lentilactobacillus kisonensis F0435 TaxID=797516 RepID=H1LGX0_9LACO|nr:hypothetical protein HMPREF9104_01851 [Lentilactobacillus kisonensis F0435]